MPALQKKFNKHGNNKHDFAVNVTGIFVLSSILLLCVFFLASCSNNDEKCTANEQLLEEQIKTKDQRITVLEDSLQKAINPSGLSLAAGNLLANSTEYSFYKSDKTKNGKVSAVPNKKYPGEFPEGSAKILNDTNIKFLSLWGIRVMLNEIYARHGMIFTDQELQNHFKHAGWYKGTKSNVDELLSNTERKNIRFINNFKFNPQIPT